MCGIFIGHHCQLCCSVLRNVLHVLFILRLSSACVWIKSACVSSEAAVLPGGEEQGDCGSASENQRVGRGPACLRPQWQPPEEEKDLICLAGDLSSAGPWHLLTSHGLEGTKVIYRFVFQFHFKAKFDLSDQLFNYAAYCALSCLTRCAVSPPCLQVTGVPREHLNTGRIPI